MIVEVITFRLIDDADEQAVLEADKRVQIEFIPNHNGFMRRTTARASDGEWCSVVLWDSLTDAEASMRKWDDHPATQALTRLIDPDSLHVKRYEDLGG